MLVYGAGAAWSRLFLPGAGAGADPIWSEPEARGPRTSGAGAGTGATQKMSAPQHCLGGLPKCSL